MLLKKELMLGGLGLSFCLVGIPSAAKAQTVVHTVSDTTFAVAPTSAHTAEATVEELTNLEPAQLTSVMDQSAVNQPADLEVAQARRRTRNASRSKDFIGVGADFGYADDVSFAVISKLSINESVAVRPSVLIGDDFSVLVPVTYEFSQLSAEVNDFQVRPYAGVGAAYSDDDEGEDFNLLLTAGVDVPISQRFTLNAQANLGVLNDTDFGVTVGIGYNFDSIFR
ncbi:MAG: hypothetical protein AAF703_01665 [Cyanobacteria bacterium P01_D01_bin.105]